MLHLNEISFLMGNMDISTNSLFVQRIIFLAFPLQRAILFRKYLPHGPNSDCIPEICYKWTPESKKNFTLNDKSPIFKVIEFLKLNDLLRKDRLEVFVETHAFVMEMFVRDNFEIMNHIKKRALQYRWNKLSDLSEEEILKLITLSRKFDKILG